MQAFVLARYRRGQPLNRGAEEEGPGGPEREGTRGLGGSFARLVLWDALVAGIS